MESNNEEKEEVHQNSPFREDSCAKIEGEKKKERKQEKLTFSE